MISNVQQCGILSGSQLLEEEVVHSLIDDDDRVYWYYIMNPYG